MKVRHMSDSNHKFDINREDLYLNGKSRVRTRKRLLQMAELGMEETGIASFGIEGVMSGLYIEKVWNYTNNEFDSYMEWVKEMISKNESNKKRQYTKQIL